MTTTTNAAVLTLTLLIPMSATAQVKPSGSKPASTQATDRRHVELEGQSNFRDIGGYRTKDGRTLKWAQIYRSGELPKLSGEDVKKLEQLKLKTVVNFLTDKEIAAHGKDRLPDGVQAISLPITGGIAGDLAAAILKARQTADFSEVPVDLNPEIHRLLIDAARKEYAALIRTATDPANRPLVFHCSHGVHRTGTAAAIILSALGVPWETVRKDYLLSNHYRKLEVERRLEQFRQQVAKNKGVAPDQVDMTNFNAFYVLEAHYIDAALDEAVKKYGAMENYIRDGLGISDETLNRLKTELLE